MNPRGTHNVTCKECGVSGSIYVGVGKRNGEHKVQDSVQHKTSCSLFVRRQPHHLTDRKTWRRQEVRANALVGARATAASGAAGQDGDGRSFHEWRVESKQTKFNAFALQQAIWGKLVKGALAAGEEPMLHVELRHRSPPERRVVVRFQWFMEKTNASVLRQPTNRVSHRISAENHTPLLVPLEPPGVELLEQELVRLLQGDT